MQPWGKTRKLTTLAMLVAAAFVLAWLDSLIPVSGALPGAKLGLANIAVLAALYLLGFRAGLAVCAVKILLTAALFGNAYSLLYSLAGGLLSFAVMAVLWKLRCSAVFTSVLGGVFHNVGQILVAMTVLETVGLIGYLPLLLLSGLGAGAAVGLAGGIVVARCRKLLK